MTQQIIPKGIPYSPKTNIVGAITSTDTVIEVADDGVFPDIGEGETLIAVISSDENFASWDPDDYETIEVAELDRVNNELKQVTRDIEREGENKSWGDGAYIACLATWELFKRLKENLSTHLSDYATNQLQVRMFGKAVYK